MKNKTGIIALLLALALAFPLVSCKTKDTSPAALTLGDYTLSEAFYSYLASSGKGNYIRSYADLDNSEEGYAKPVSEEGGLTVGEYLDNLTLDNAKMTLAAIKLFDDYGLSLTAEEKKSVKDYVDDLVKEYGDGDRKMFNGLLSAYGIDTDLLTDFYLEEAKSTAVYKYLYKDGGKEKLSIKDLNDFLSENYVHFQMIYVNNSYESVTDEEGFFEYDEYGFVKTVPLAGEKKAEKDALVKKCEKKLEEGEDFFELYEKYSEVTDYAGGWYLSPTGDYDDPVFTALAAETAGIEIGEYKTVQTETGCCIVYRLEVEDGAYNDSRFSDFFSDFTDNACSAAYTEKLSSMFPSIEVNGEIIEKYSVADVLPCYY